MVNGYYFLSWAGIGLDSNMIQDTENMPLLKQLFGRVGYGLSGLRTLLSYSPSRVSVDVDGKHYHGYFILVGNIKYYGGKFRVLPKASTNDGLLDVCIFKGKTLMHNFKYSIAMGLGQVVHYDDVDYIHGKKIRIDTFHKALIHVDGELVSKTPANIIVKPKFLKVIA